MGRSLRHYDEQSVAIGLGRLVASMVQYIFTRVPSLASAILVQTLTVLSRVAVMSAVGVH